MKLEDSVLCLKQTVAEPVEPLPYICIYFFWVCFPMTLSPTGMSFKVSLPLMLFKKYFVCIFVFPCVCCMSLPTHLPQLFENNFF